ncbi:MAG TPA: hypothetical protein VFR81_24000 [Longimicrobium sp.]|nr:hypothetical protein [Longimicrobium sp.]
MRKISLDVSALRVESFETANDASAKPGTVRGYATQLLGCVQTAAGQTQCGQQCLSGWRPCQPTDAWTNGEQMCWCGESGQYAC